jgi:hypothetical protein
MALAWTDLAGSDEGCPAPWKACMTETTVTKMADGAEEQERWARKARRWMAEAWLRCGDPS